MGYVILFLVIIAIYVWLCFLAATPVKWLQERYNRDGFYVGAGIVNVLSVGIAGTLMGLVWCWAKGPDMEGKTELDDISKKMDEINKSLEDIAHLMKEKSQL